MKVSIAHHIKPTALILGKDSRKPWGRTDVVLAKAYQRFVDELCQQCGLPKFICHSDDNRIQFKIGRDSCSAAAVSEKEQERASEANSKKYGERIFGQPYLIDSAVKEGVEFADFRTPYMLEQAKKAGLIPDQVSGN